MSNYQPASVIQPTRVTPTQTPAPAPAPVPIPTLSLATTPGDILTSKPTQMFAYDYLDYLIGASSFIVALAWNSAFQKYFEQNKFFSKSGPWVYAITVTFIVTLVMLAVKYFQKKISNDKKNNKFNSN